MKQWIEKNKVLLIGFLMAVAMPLYELFKDGSVSLKIAAFTFFTAGLAWAANNLRGQWASIAGILGVSLATFITMQSTGTISWGQLVLQFVINILAVLSGPAKFIGYEKSDLIAQAKQDGKNRAA